ncbi:MAG TPA: nuclear transport factor 2 family protein [Gemmatimonadota bacterium]|nr:nuclear transport factor 2 family protein [Gemmatimonadota bacterium]
MQDPKAEIRAMVDRETRAWDALDVETLLDLFHPDMVWPWPPSPRDHDPARWIFVLGRFDRARWAAAWGELFATHELVHNRREIARIEVTPEADGALAVVDVDTLWRSRADGAVQHWKGRAGKVYARVDGEWRMTMHTGLLDYGVSAGTAAGTPRTPPPPADPPARTSAPPS